MKARYKPEYVTEECWLYPKEVVKVQRQYKKKNGYVNIVDREGRPIMDSQSGLCITLEDFESETFGDFIKHCRSF
jgi:hypothetical protein